MSDELAPTPESSDPPLTEADYAAISGLLMESARGRWFLAEYARRNRQADTTLVLAAIARIESAVGTPSVAAVQSELAEMAAAMARLEAEVAALKPDTGREGNGAQEVIQLVSELGGRIDAMIASWAHAPAVAEVSAPKAMDVVAELLPAKIELPAPAPARIEVPVRPAIDTEDIVWVEADRVRHSAGGLPGPIPEPPAPAVEPIPEVELPEISFVALPQPAQAPTLPAGMPTTDVLADIFELEIAAPVTAEAEPEALPVQEPVSQAETEALAAAALALLAQAEDAACEIAAAIAEREPAPAEPEPAPREAEPVPADPLAPLYALSEDEKIALFS